MQNPFLQQHQQQSYSNINNNNNNNNSNTKPFLQQQSVRLTYRERSVYI